MSQTDSRSPRSGTMDRAGLQGLMRRLPPLVRASMNRAARRKPAIGICVDRAVAIAVPDGETWQIDTFERPEDDAGLRRDLAAAVDRLFINGRSAILTLPIGAYTLVQIEKPPVPAEELVDACRWKIKDLVDFPIEDALIGTFDAAPARGRGDHPTLNVVIAPAAPVKSMLRTLRDAGLNPAGVGIAELALRKLVLPHDQDAQPTAVVSLAARHGIIQISQGDTLMFARRLDYGLRALGSFDPGTTGPHSRLPLDLQRTLDYFDRNYDAGPVTRLLITPNHPQLLAFMTTVGGESGLAVAPIGGAPDALTGTTLPEIESTEGALALGGAMCTGGAAFDLASDPQHAQRTLPGPRHALGALAATMLLSIVTGLWMQSRLEAATLASQKTEREIEQLADDLADRGSHLSERNADPELLRELRRLEQDAAEKRRVLEALTGSTLGNTHGFSGLLEGLGRGMPRNVWLTRIAFDHGGAALRLEGETLDAAHVPELLESLHGQPAFSGTSLARLSIARDGTRPGWLRFILATPCLPDAGSTRAAGGAACTGTVDEDPAS